MPRRDADAVQRCCRPRLALTHHGLSVSMMVADTLRPDRALPASDRYPGHNMTEMPASIDTGRHADLDADVAAGVTAWLSEFTNARTITDGDARTSVMRVPQLQRVSTVLPNAPGRRDGRLGFHC